MISNYKSKELIKFAKTGVLSSVIEEFNKSFPKQKVSISSIAKEIKSDPKTLNEIDKAEGKYEQVFFKVTDKFKSLFFEKEKSFLDDSDEVRQLPDKSFFATYPIVRYKEGNTKYHYLHLDDGITKTIELFEIGSLLIDDKAEFMEFKDLCADKILFEVGENYPYEDEKKEVEVIKNFCAKFKRLNKFMKENWSDLYENIEISFEKKELTKECNNLLKKLCKKKKSIFWKTYKVWRRETLENQNLVVSTSYISSTISIIVFGNVDDKYFVRVSEGSLPPNKRLTEFDGDVQVDGIHLNEWLKQNYGKEDDNLF